MQEGRTLLFNISSTEGHCFNCFVSFGPCQIFSVVFRSLPRTEISRANFMNLHVNELVTYRKRGFFSSQLYSPSGRSPMSDVTLQ